MEDLINWVELSRHLAGNESSVSRNRCPKKYQKKVDSLIEHLKAWGKKIEIMDIEEKKRLQDAATDLLLQREALKTAIRGLAESEISKRHNDLTVSIDKHLLDLLDFLDLQSKESNL